VGGDDAADSREVFGGDGTPKHGNDEMMMTKAMHPVFDGILRNHLEMRLEAKFVCAVRARGLERGEAASRRNLNQHAEGKISWTTAWPISRMLTLYWARMPVNSAVSPGASGPEK
jgi:hypothetical protein